MKPYLEKISSNVDLTYEEAADAMQLIMSGESTDAQFGSFVTGLRMKGETVDEIAGMASVMRKMALSVNYDNDLLDTCGTGGDGLGTFNISTAAAFVSAGIGIKIAKHGNRAMSSHTGSADVLESLGININLTPDQVSECIKISNFGFMFAQGFHPAMKHAGPPRREIGIRTVFNILGPLTNPAGAQKQLIGVSDPKVGNFYTFIKALGGDVGSSILEKDKVLLATKILSDAKLNGVNLLLPVDSVNAKAAKNNATIKMHMRILSKQPNSMTSFWMRGLS